MKAFVHLVYLDDSSDDLNHQIIGAAIVPEEKFMAIEKVLGSIIEDLVHEDLRESFEFHASALFHSKSPFENVSRDQATDLLRACALVVQKVPIPIIYGAADLRELRRGPFATAQPIDVAFRLCLKGIARWFEQQDGSQIGIIICDEPKSEKIKKDLQKAFRAYRRPLKSREHQRGILAYIHDDMYFGDSAYSIGIQLADICSFIILRHLQKKALRKNSTGPPFHAAFSKATNSIFVAARRWAFSSR